MGFLRICAVILLLAWMTCIGMRAQPSLAPVETGAGVHTATFETPRGTIRVHVSSDAAPGDSISGRILADPTGATPQERKDNLEWLNGLVLEWQDQRTRVATGAYEWSIPIALRAGSAGLFLRDPDGGLVSQASIPVDPVPPARIASSPADTIEFPTDGEIDGVAVIRGRSGDALANKVVTVGGAEAELLASSPRQLAFRVPTTSPGPVPFRFSSGKEPLAEGTMRVIEVRVVASSTQMFRGQRATLTITVLGLTGITKPMTLAVVNQSPANVRVENVDRPITISPSQVRRGTAVVTRRIVGLQPGPFQIAASVGQPPTAQFDVLRTTTRTLTAWQARTGVGITGGATDLIQRSVPEARLDDFLSRQRAYRGDAEEVFAALLSHYCFNLRDDGLSQRRAIGGPGAGIMLAAFGRNRAAQAMITEREVRRLSFSDFVSRLTERFTMRQAAGYLFVRSTTPQAPITLDGRHNGELTDRRFVTPVGDHQIVVTGAQTCRRQVTVNAFQTSVVDCGS
jgi:hypothetical protein